MNTHWSNRHQASLAACLAAGLNIVILAVLGISPAIAVGSHVMVSL